MSLLARLEPKLRRFAVPNLTAVLIAGQVAMYVANMIPVAQGRPPVLNAIRLVPDKVIDGEVWRLVTYLFDPPPTNPIFAFFGWYLFYLMGTTLESVWGTFRYNVFIALGYLASVAMAFVFWYVFRVPGAAATNVFLGGTVFLAFARFYPDFVLMIMFILPVKIRWLALLTWIGYAITFLGTDDWLTRLMIVAAVSNYLVFFGRDIWTDMKHGHRRMQFRAKAVRNSTRVMHQCRVCGVNSNSSPQTQFRYCTQCDGDACYCLEHIRDHKHVGSEKRAESNV